MEKYTTFAVKAVRFTRSLSLLCCRFYESMN